MKFVFRFYASKTYASEPCAAKLFVSVHFHRARIAKTHIPNAATVGLGYESLPDLPDFTTAIKFSRFTLPMARPMSGVTRSFTNELTIAVKAAPARG